MTYLKRYTKSLFYAFEDLIGGDQKKNIELQNIHKNKRCFILCTGTSLDEIEPKDLTQEYVFSCNLIIYWKGFQDISLDFYSATNHFLAYDPVDQKKMYKDLSLLNKNKDLKVFFRSLNKLILKRNLFSKKNTYFFKPKNIQSFSEEAPKINLHKKTEYSDGVFEFQLALAMYMGFSEIYLVGCGTTYQPSLEYHFYDEDINFNLNLPWQKPIFYKSSLNIDKDSEEFAIRNNLTLFSKIDYGDHQVHRFTSDNFDIHLEKKFLRLQELADGLGVKIYNITPEGLKSPIFYEVRSSEVFK